MKGNLVKIILLLRRIILGKINQEKRYFMGLTGHFEFLRTVTQIYLPK